MQTEEEDDWLPNQVIEPLANQKAQIFALVPLVASEGEGLKLLATWPIVEDMLLLQIQLAFVPHSVRPLLQLLQVD